MGLDMYLYAEREVPVQPDLHEELDGDGEKYVSGYEFATPDEERQRYKRLVELAELAEAADPETPSAIYHEQDGSARLQACVAYWRKANAIHAWFVTNCQGGVDECQLSDPISREQLRELRTLCETALSQLNLEDGEVVNGYRIEGGERVTITAPGKVATNPEVAMELLPPVSGFFFGSSDIDEWYVSDLRQTIKQIDRVLEHAPADAVIRYRSSW